MPAYVREIEKRKCQQCGATATCQVFNTFNALVGWFCRRHGEARARLLNSRSTDA